MKEKNNKAERPIAYPRPSDSDRQIQNQPEYIDEEPNKFDKEVSDAPLKEDDKK